MKATKIFVMVCLLNSFCMIAAEAILGVNLFPQASAAGIEVEVLYNGISLPSNPRQRTNVMDYGFEPLPVPYLDNPPAVIPIGIGRQLFVDDFLIEETTLSRIYHKAQKYEGNPIFKAETDLEKQRGIPGAVPKSGGIWWDSKDNLFKMWYEASWLGNMAYATSKDGINWDRPVLDFIPGTNALVPDIRPDSTTVWLDHQAKNPNERFKMFIRPYSVEKNALVMVSADGINWSEPVVTGGMGDRSTIFYNPFRDKWIYGLRSGWAGSPEPVYNADGSQKYDGRARNYSEHDNLSDGVSFPDQTRWLRADKLDKPDPEIGDRAQLYNFDAVAYESLMIGFHQIHLGPDNRICEQSGTPKITELKLSYSRDGYHWHRPDRDAFIAATRKEGDWDRGYLQSVGGVFLVAGDELWFYYIGYSGDTRAEDEVKYRFRDRIYYNGKTGLAKLRRDGFASMGAGEKGGTLTTRLISFAEGVHLFVNIDNPGGQFYAEVLDAEGNVVKGLSKSDCLPLSVGSTLAQVGWKDGQDLSRVQNRPIRFKFYLMNGKLYSFWISDKSGASRGYLAAGGPGYGSNIDKEGKQAVKLKK